jgi:hypothetical protein
VGYRWQIVHSLSHHLSFPSRCGHRARRVAGGEGCVCWAISPFRAKRKLEFLDQPASGALGRVATAIEKSDRVPVFFYRLEQAYGRGGRGDQLCVHSLSQHLRHKISHFLLVQRGHSFPPRCGDCARVALVCAQPADSGRNVVGGIYGDVVNAGKETVFIKLLCVGAGGGERGGGKEGGCGEGGKCFCVCA